MISGEGEDTKAGKEDGVWGRMPGPCVLSLEAHPLSHVGEGWSFFQFTSEPAPLATTPQLSMGGGPDKPHGQELLSQTLNL